MKRRSFLTLAGCAAVAAANVAPRQPLDVRRVRAVVRLGRADRATLVGVAGGCASRRAASPLGGYALADLV